MNLRELQTEHEAWMRHNFGEAVEPWRPLVGVMEELGEVAHAVLKKRDGIRPSEDYLAELQDGVGDIVIFLAGFATAVGFDLEEAVAETWAKVKRRDWKKDPVSGGQNAQG